MRVDQLVPAFHQGDAIGDTALHMKRFFLSQGFDSQIYCLSRDRGLEGQCELFGSFPPPSTLDITILHFALPSPLTEAFIGLPSKKVMIYHNITPAEFFSDYSQELEGIARRGREELESLVPYVSLVLADSEYNRREILKLGFRQSVVFPLFVDFEKYRKPPNRLLHHIFRDSRTNILFVGRIAPNKKIEDLVRVTFYFKKYISPMVRLIVVGKTSTVPEYYRSLIRLADEFYLSPEEICFTGHIPDEELYALYRASDVFLSMSEHEGFGLPFIECMIFDLPVMAYDCCAVPFTLGDAGILLKEKRIDGIAELLNIVAHDTDMREKIIQRQRSRLKRFKDLQPAEALKKRLKALFD